MKSAEVRQRFLDFFQSNGHQVVDSSSLVPENDPTLLFTNAGMNQFKDVFLGLDQRSYVRATSSQRCVRAGGKHNDLENVGYTARHHTFFEMLGNFSFGDYFKKEAIHFAWTFLTAKEWMNIPAEKLLVTVYATDDEAYDLWHNEIGLPAEKIIRIGDNKGAQYASDNFWQMGDTGPCGPCTEIFYDHGDHIWGGVPGSAEEDGDRFIEIWNCVFMQFNRDEQGNMNPLPKPSVDTGMGLERISAVMQSVHSNYEIDLFANLIKATAQITNTSDLSSKSLRVIADHIRSASFLIVDGVVPSNEGRGYVLRRIIRRALRHGHILGAQGTFFYKIVAALVAEMGDAYPDLAKRQAHVEKVIVLEEEQFAKTLANGMKVLEQAISELQGSMIAGETVFKLYDTYGFPVDLTADIARERELSIDEAGFEVCMEEQRNMARSASNFKGGFEKGIDLAGITQFTGYEALSDDTNIVAIYKDGLAVNEITEGDEAVIVLAQTAFYGESGGQVGDTGYIFAEQANFEVNDCQKDGKHHVHIGKVISGSFAVNGIVKTMVDEDKRSAIAKHHSATHLLQAALQQVLGEHVQQKGSFCDDQRLRFDFSNLEAVSADDLASIESMVNQQVLANTPVVTQLMNIDAAKAKGAMALFGEKYDDEVRVLSMGEDDFSVELCGGTHVDRTGTIGLVKIVSEQGIASGVRRIEAVAGLAALKLINGYESNLAKVASLVKGNKDTAFERVEAALSKQKQLEKEIDALKSKLAAAAGSDLAGDAQDVNGVKLVVAQLDADVNGLVELIDQLKNKLGSAVVMLASNDGKLAAGVSKDLTAKVKAGEVLNHVATQCGGKGGGKPDLAKGGAQDLVALPAALASVAEFLATKV